MTWLTPFSADRKEGKHPPFHAALNEYLRRLDATVLKLPSFCQPSSAAAAAQIERPPPLIGCYWVHSTGFNCNVAGIRRLHLQYEIFFLQRRLPRTEDPVQVKPVRRNSSQVHVRLAPGRRWPHHHPELPDPLYCRKQDISLFVPVYV